MYNYEHCETMIEALVKYQSNVRLILINADKDELRHELYTNDHAFLDYISGRLNDADNTADKEI